MSHNCNDVLKNPAPNLNLVGHRIDQGRLELISVLGLGAYGVVYLAQDLTSTNMNHPNLYAVKVLNKIGLDARQKSFQRREIALHSLASPHPSIVTLHAVIESSSCVFVVLDYCPDGDLFGMITEKKKYLGKTDAIKSVFSQIIDAVQFCHCLGISHRDLKPENILCKDQGDAVVLADFGLATIEKTSSDFGCGSTFYMSPECHSGLFGRLGSYSTFPNDVWSLGVILVNLTCGRNPWKQASPSDETFRAYLANPDFLRSILPISESCNSLLKRIFCPNPLTRITLEELKVEVSRIETFDMSRSELSRATKATREAARALHSNALSPKVAPPPAEVARCDCNPHASDLSCSVKSTRPMAWNLAQRKQTNPSQVRRDRTDLLPARTCFDQTTLSNLDSPCAHIILPTAPLLSTFMSTSTSQQSSPSSDQQPRRRRGFSSRLFKASNVAHNVAQTSSKEESHRSNRRNIAKPMSFRRPNAPCPIIVNRTPSIAAACYVPLTPNRLAASPRKGCMFGFLPFTPPASASPSRATFGFISKPSRFFHLNSSSVQALPPTPPTPNHHIQFGLPSSSSPSA